MPDVSSDWTGPAATPIPVAGTALQIVGIGCSAGGLDALQRFFASVPAESHLAFVVVQHLSPAHHSALPQLLASAGQLPVVEVTDGMVVQAGRIHVIPPGHDMVVHAGALHLQAPPAMRGLHLPIDLFLQSLAHSHPAQCVGVLLSGMGSDGVAGLAAIRASGGLTLVQAPDSAQAEGMPASAIRAGVAEVVGLPETLAARITRQPGRVAWSPTVQVNTAPVSVSEPAFDTITGLLRQHSGNDFSLYKSNTLMRRIQRRMAVRQVASLDDYARLAALEPQELALLFQELLIGVTSFFRDPAVWDELRDVALPALLARYPAGKTLRAWVPACSTGEEAYTLAMVLAEALHRVPHAAAFTVQIFATDLDINAVEVARKGLYPAGIAADVSAERLARFFTPQDGGGYRIKKTLRDTLVFATQNIASDPPFTRLDVLSCRNLLIYFEAPLQKRLLPLFHYALTPGGLLVLGSAESTGNFAHLFAPVNHKARIFCRDALPRGIQDLNFTLQRPATLTVAQEPPISDLTDSMGRLTDQLIQQTWAPAGVLVTAEGDILYISGRTGKYLEPAVGKTNINIHAMARSGLREALAGVIHRAVAEQVPVRLRGLRVQTDGGTQIVNVTVQALDKPEPLRGRVILVFEDVAPAARPRKGGGAELPPSTSAMQAEVQQLREALSATHEAMQITVEELRSSNEELQSTNEELQSTNEELTTSKEELQSVNEELQTVNTELQSKVDDLTWVKNDMANLLNSTEIATVFLDNHLHVRRFTTHAVRLFRLIHSDVGRPLAHVVTDLDYPGLVHDAQEVLSTLIFKETVARTHDDRWFRVRVMPYRTQENVIDGVVMTFTDVTAIKLLEAELRGARNRV